MASKKRSAKELRLLALELYFTEKHDELELVMSEMAERFPRTHRSTVKELDSIIHEQHDLDCVGEIKLC
ncbi:gp29 [Shigella phage Buco]|uniref:Uncharacterized protein n=1 Tax=Shigella phage Buco TaxID=2530183 RepID=A0A482JKT1_9CAUD|nr:gp29 [Shigella phage Buco]QBP32929.1 hypothetical protein HRP29_gp29 [Shigella phage Buco]